MLDTHATAGTGPNRGLLYFDSISDDARVRHTHTHTHTHTCKHPNRGLLYQNY